MKRFFKKKKRIPFKYYGKHPYFQKVEIRDEFGKKLFTLSDKNLNEGMHELNFFITRVLQLEIKKKKRLV